MLDGQSLDMANQDSEHRYAISQCNDPTALRRINEQKRRFWSQQSELRELQMSNDAVVKIATNDVRSEAERRLPVAWHKTFEQALADAESAQRIAQEHFSRRGGKLSKRDSLQKLILRIVGKNPTITTVELLRELRKHDGLGTIYSIDGKSPLLNGKGRMIHYFDDSLQKEKTAPLSGLKDRLSRAKKYSR
jgi:hypothetical protein